MPFAFAAASSTQAVRLCLRVRNRAREAGGDREEIQKHHTGPCSVYGASISYNLNSMEEVSNAFFVIYTIALGCGFAILFDGERKNPMLKKGPWWERTIKVFLSGAFFGIISSIVSAPMWGLLFFIYQVISGN